jgi:hypothetical protein
MRKDGKEIDRTEYYEHSWADAEHLYWEVPDGKYMVCQGNLPPCIVTVKKGQVVTYERNGKVAGNNVSVENDMDGQVTRESVGDIMHMKHEDIVIEVVDEGKDITIKGAKVDAVGSKTKKP